MRAEVLAGERDEVLEFALERLELGVARVLNETELDLRQLVLQAGGARSRRAGER